MKSAGGFFSSFISKGKKLLKDSQKVVSETKAKLNDEIAAISHKEIDGVNDDEMLLHLNLVHDGSLQFKEYEDNSFRYFTDEEEVKETEEESKLTTVDYVFVVGFDHKIGSVIEYFHPTPEESVIDENVSKALCFLGLPDGSHSVQSDYSFFIVPDAKGRLYYGVSCFRQIKSSELTEKDEKVSRSFVQKSVCALCRIPIFATLMIKLLPTTQAYFCQK